jgi:hypothetical protein
MDLIAPRRVVFHPLKKKWLLANKKVDKPRFQADFGPVVCQPAWYA